MNNYCKCDKQFGELSVYAWKDGESVLICEQCQQIDDPMTHHYNTIRNNSRNTVDKPEPENKKDDKFNSDHFWMLFINPIAKALDDTNEYKADILDKTIKIQAKHIKNSTFEKENITRDAYLIFIIAIVMNQRDYLNMYLHQKPKNASQVMKMHLLLL